MPIKAIVRRVARKTFLRGNFLKEIVFSKSKSAIEREIVKEIIAPRLNVKKRLITKINNVAKIRGRTLLFLK